VLIVLNPDRGVVNVFDSLRKPESEYQEIIDMFTRSYIFTVNFNNSNFSIYLHY